MSGKYVNVYGSRSGKAEQQSQAAAKRRWPVLEQTRRAPLCNVNSATLEGALDGNMCAEPDGTVPIPECAGDEPLAPLWRRERTDVGARWGEWAFVSGWACPADLLPRLSLAEFRELPIPALPALRQPDGEWVLVNKETIVFTEPNAQVFRTVVAGYPMDVVATPVSYRWDFGDGTSLSTTEPGRPYPAMDVFHVYQRVGAVRMTLTTTWEGRYRLDSDPTGAWREVPGTATTTAQGTPFEVREYRTRLVDADCDNGSKGAGCG